MIGHYRVVGVVLALAASRGPAAVVPVFRTKAQPVIDGRLAEPLWQRPPDFAGFTVIRTGTPAGPPTDAWAAADGDWLFLAFRCHEPQPAGIVREIRVRDQSVQKDDSIEVFLSPGTGGETYYHFVVNAAGVQGDNMSLKYGADPRGWDGHWRSAAAIDRDGTCWTAELAIPLFQLQSRGDGPWSFNLCRNRRMGSLVEHSSWSPLAGDSFNAPREFGAAAGLAEFTPGTVFAPVVAALERGAFIDLPERRYKVRVQIVNTGDPGALALSVDDVIEGRPTTTGPVPVAAAAGITVQEITVPVEEFVQSRTLVTASFTDRLGEWTVVREVAPARDLAPYTVFLEQPFYTTREPEAALCLSVNVPWSALETPRVRIGVNGTDREFAVERLEQRFAFSVAGLEPGTYPVAATLLNGRGAVLYSETLTLVRTAHPEKGNVIAANYWDHTVHVNGEPFIPYGFVGGGVDPALLAEMGCNALVDWTYTTGPEPMNALMDACAAYDIRVMLWTMRGFQENLHRLMASPRERVLPAIRKFLPDIVTATREHPALLSYLMFDEPGGEEMMEVTRVYYDAIKALAPTIPAQVNMCRVIPVGMFKSDVGMLDIYWDMSDENPMSMRPVLAWYREMARYIGVVNQPVWLATAANVHRAARFFTPREQRINTYMGIIYGAAGIYYFPWPPSHVDEIAMFNRLSRELKALGPALATRPPVQSVSCVTGDSDMFHAALRREPGGDCVLIVGNAYGLPGTLTVRFDGLDRDGQVTDFFSGDPLRVAADGAITERYDGYDVNVYRVRNCRLDPTRNVALRLVSTLEMPDDRAAAAANVLPPFTEDGWHGPVAFDTTSAVAGQRSLRLTRNADEPTRIVRSKPIPLKPGAQYGLTVRVKGEFTAAPERWGGPDVAVYSLDRKKYVLHQQTHAAHLQNWTEYRKEFTALPDRAETVQCMLSAPANKYTGSAWFDRIELREVEPDTARKNRIPNSGFEIAALPGMPDCVRYHTFFATGAENFVGRKDPCVVQDFAVRFEGDCALRLKAGVAMGPLSPKGGIGQLDQDTRYTLSFRAKASKPGSPMGARLGTGDWRKLDVGTDWQRYEMTAKPDMDSQGRVHLAVELRADDLRLGFDAGTYYWIDAVQLEEGETASDYEPDAYTVARRRR